jgi:hypothetical protein
VQVGRQSLVVKLRLLLVLALVASSRVGVVVNTRVTSELVGAGELFAASGELAGVRLLASVSSDVAGLVFQTMEGLLAKGALVRPRQLVGRLGGLGTRDGPVGLDDGDGSGSHVAVCLLRLLVLGGSCGGGIEQIWKIHGRLWSLLHVIHRSRNPLLAPGRRRDGGSARPSVLAESLVIVGGEGVDGCPRRKSESRSCLFAEDGGWRKKLEGDLFLGGRGRGSEWV